MGTWKAIHLERENLQFSIFTAEDVKKLSVAKIITGLTFDTLGRPLSGGLYDPLMGTYARSTDPCATCLTFANCPGHLGHIDLQSLVYNPFFYKMIYDILKLCCLHCFKMQFTEHAQKIQLLQFELFNAGYILEAKDLAVYKSEMVSVSAGKLMKTESGETVHPKIAEMYELLQSGPNENNIETKTSCAIRTDLIRDILQSTPISKLCMFCSKPYKKVRYSYKKLVMSLSKEDKDQLSAESVDKAKGNKVILADECRDYLREIYKNHSKLLQEIFPLLKTCSGNVEYPTDSIFMNIIAVTPPKSRPINVMNDQIIEHPQTLVYRDIINANSILRLILENRKQGGVDLRDEAKVTYENARGSTPYEKIYYAWQELQKNVDMLLDSSIDRNRNDLQGLKQVLEKKEGLIRKHMMGKRVNFAARTVITPDPNINVEEVGIPDIFAKKLSYPVPVTSWNIVALRKLVMNGPDVHPGANYIEDEKGMKIMIPADNPAKRESYAKLLLTAPENGIKIVHRHLLNGDILLLNRQPTLHRPSIMAHKARILQGEKTFRLHYSNCKAYNADFDGDEMNAHFPQNEIARSEAYNIANVANQYLVPKDGTPLGGLIQDHVISGVKLSLRGRFFNREDYQQLVYQGLAHIRGDIKLLPPTILKPFKLWSGKQVLSTLIINITSKGYPLINLTSSAKVNTKYWQVQPHRRWTVGGTSLRGNEMSESEVIIREGELIVGVLDKEQYGATKYGLIHCMYELYGGECSTQLLTAFTKLFTNFLQREGFTLGVQDILVTSQADHKRRKIIRECRRAGNEIAAAALNLDEVPPPDILADKLEEAYEKNPRFRVVLDRNYKSVLDKYTNDINQTCLPAGLISKFPQNNLQLMVLSGAKGSMVNTMQISCLLGQIELEGKRPPLMISGKSLPSFATFETSPKSGGFIDGRFMTGIQPQDFFFHCMAGREGLIDTAVKTSRSGYLQRCLIKHLEGLSVGYDLTVRDSDNSVVQFLYGEDGLDVSRSRFFNQKALKFLDDNMKVVLHNRELEKIKNEEIFAKIKKRLKKLKSWKKKNGNLYQKLRSSAFQRFSAEIRNEIEIENAKTLNLEFGRLNLDHKITKLWLLADEEKKKSYQKKYAPCPEPVTSVYKQDNFYGAVSEYLEELMENYVKTYPDRKAEIKDVVYLKAMQAIAQPGEPVGLLAAQSVGEPSTQMTLNTFHFAGRGEMNVTLGIPRLREILMLASVNIKTPSMDIPFKPNQVRNAEKFRIKFNRVVLADVLEYVNVKLKLVLRPDRAYLYTVHFKFLPRDAYSDEFSVKPKHILKYMSNVFFKQMFRVISNSAKNKYTIIEVEEKPKQDKTGETNEEEDDDGLGTEMNKTTEKIVDIADSSDDDNNEANDDDDATGIKLRNRKHDENEYDDPEVEEEVQDANENDDVEEVPLNEYDKSLDDIDDEMQSELLVSNQMVNDYVYDKEAYLWCQLTFSLPIRYKNLDISSILKGLAHKSVIYQVPNIKRAITYTHNDDLILKTEGINIAQMFSYDKYLDLNRLYSNDIHAIAKIYGIEAATRVIVKEVQNVFKVYGIEVDTRHLLMIADYMTFDGTFKPLSRKGMEYSASPLQQMSFESCLQFLKTAVFHGRKDDLLSPSSRLMVGLPVKSGTGIFSLESKIC